MYAIIAKSQSETAEVKKTTVRFNNVLRQMQYSINIAALYRFGLEVINNTVYLTMVKANKKANGALEGK